MAPLWQLLKLQAQILGAGTAFTPSAQTIQISQRGRTEVSLTPIPRWSLTSSLFIVSSPSFILSSLGFTAVAFVTGSLALWAPAFLLRSRVVLGETPPAFLETPALPLTGTGMGTRLGGPAGGRG